MKKFSMYKFLASSEEEILDSVKKFFKDNGHYPSYKELDECEYTPTSRTIIRRFGSLHEFRNKFNLGSLDQRKDISAQNKREETMKKRIEILKYLEYLKIKLNPGSTFSLAGKKYKISSNTKLKGVIIINNINDLKERISTTKVK